MIFLAHFVGGGIGEILNLSLEDYVIYLNKAIELYRQENHLTKKVIISGIEKR